MKHFIYNCIYFEWGRDSGEPADMLSLSGGVKLNEISPSLADPISQFGQISLFEFIDASGLYGRLFCGEGANNSQRMSKTKAEQGQY